jgi:carbamoyl-phosphate synthase large subunit
MEHIEEAGIHSGDSACSIPPRTIKEEHLKTIERYTKKIAKELKVIGLVNIQFAICKDEVYILEANPRASRTVPFVSKVVGIPIARIATQLMLGKKIKNFPELRHKKFGYVGVKEAVFPFNMFPEVDPVLGPEMRATGEVMGIARTFGLAFYKAEEASGSRLPTKGNILFTVTDKDKKELAGVAKRLQELGFSLYATENTHKYLGKKGVTTLVINKIHQGRPNIADAIKNGQLNLIINTPMGRHGKLDDDYIRMMATQYKIPYITTMAAAKAAVDGISEVIKGEDKPLSLQEYHKVFIDVPDK